MSDAEAGKTTPSPVPVPATPAAPAAPAAPASSLLATVDDFRKLAFRVGVIVSAQDHPNADRLFVLQVEVGEPTPRQVVAGIKGSYQAADLVGKHVAVVANLQPATIRGVESRGMVLAASAPDGSQMAILTPDRPIPPGGVIK